jgi:hypothetical protein
MAIGKSRRIVIDVDDVQLKRRLHVALAADGRSLKDWFVAAAVDYLDARLLGTQLELPVPRAAEGTVAYLASPAVDRKL